MLHLTPAMLEAAYELLRATSPFRRWKLPEPDDVEFRVTREKNLCGTCHRNEKLVWCIAISTDRVGRLDNLIRVLAHELIHIREEDYYPNRQDVQHSAVFVQLAAQVCRHHGFDEKLF
jgi:hypothetical protein